MRTTLETRKKLFNIRHGRSIYFIIVYFATFGVFLYLFDEYLVTEVNNNVILANLGFALLITFFAFLQYKGRLHFGMSLFIVGFIMFIIGGVSFFGNAEFKTLGITALWEMDETRNKVVLALIFIVGFLLMLINAYAYMQNWIFARPFGHGRRLGG